MKKFEKVREKFMKQGLDELESETKAIELLINENPDAQETVDLFKNRNVQNPEKMALKIKERGNALYKNCRNCDGCPEVCLIQHLRGLAKVKTKIPFSSYGLSPNEGAIQGRICQNGVEWFVDNLKKDKDMLAAFWVYNHESDSTVVDGKLSQELAQETIDLLNRFYPGTL